jgi:hypothetical protein
MRAGEPDLAALLMPPHVASSSENFGVKTFYDLDRRPTIDMEEVAPHPGRRIVFAGVPSEYDIPTPEGRESRLLLASGNTASFRYRNGFSYISLKVSYGTAKNPPESFKGMSGGGVWVVPTKGDPARVDGPATLIGVGFRELTRDGRVTSVRCHGSKEIYGLARREISKAIKRPTIWKGNR